MAGLDIAKAEVEVTIRVPSDTVAGRRQQETRTYGTTRGELDSLADWLACWGVAKAGMEATGDYWKPVFFLLESRGFDCDLYNAGQVKALPGRPKIDLLTELSTGSLGGCGRRPGRVAGFARCDQQRGRAGGLVAAGGAVAGLAGGDRGSIRPVSAG